MSFPSVTSSMDERTEWTVRRTTSDDAPAILSLHVASIRAFGPDAYDEREVEAWATKDHGPEGYPVEDDRRRMFVAEAADAVAGFGQVNVDDSEVVAVYVHPDHARRGVGSALLSRLEAEVRDEDLDSLALTASLNAVPFYERMGYEPVAEVTHATTDEVDLTCVRMGKKL